MNFAKAEFRNTDDIPQPYSKKIDYTPLYRKVAKLEDHEAIQIPIEKDHQTTNIQNALDREFTHTKFKAFTRTIDGQKYTFVTKA